MNGLVSSRRVRRSKWLVLLSMCRNFFGSLCSLALSCLILNATFVEKAWSEPLELFMDVKSKQLFAEPGPGRVSLGKFVPAEEAATKEEVKKVETIATHPPAPSISSTPNAATVTAASNAQPGKNWADKISLRGYTQFRQTSLFDDEDDDGKAGWFHPADRSVSEDASFIIRRARLIFSGDVTDHLYIYIQPELNASPGEGDFSVQLRDAYGDIAFDEKKEWRIRAGQSKVPYGFVNLQSSQNRLTLERAEAINNAVETERDVGMFLMWAPAEIRERFRHLVSSGLKGSGDYGVFATGVYNGQGPNRSDQNGEFYSVARMTYPFKFANGQFFEPGIQGYIGNFVPRTSSVTLDDGTKVTPTWDDPDGVRDQRAALTAVLYPQPFGFETEWNIGKGPGLSDDYSTIDEQNIKGGYILANYKLDLNSGTYFPFVRWQYLDGGRKFARNAPEAQLNEWDFGVEWSPWKEIELTAQYSYTRKRTNTNEFAYGAIESAHRLGLQLQWNY